MSNIFVYLHLDEFDVMYISEDESLCEWEHIMYFDAVNGEQKNLRANCLVAELSMTT